MKDNNDESNDDIVNQLEKLLYSVMVQSRPDPEYIKKILQKKCKLEDYGQKHIINRLVDEVLGAKKALEDRRANHEIIKKAKNIVFGKSRNHKVSGKVRKLTKKEKEDLR